ncbi:hypothetical protein WOB53_06965 [Providencia rettgeri]|uniref:hypothetical protein n=1 Tax=Providencia rettgeri TaxID=587 RepID=UPI0024AC46D0|nr:hypothetical protein [Providencia rettgeri]MCK9998670.1 hypothetical protein [Providencia rettgeri]HEP0306354.1 hypothetical protein [Providencia rettgeri]
MDYYLTESDRVGMVILHKKTCTQLIQHGGATYVGYYFGEYGALQKVESMTTDVVIKCPECMTDIQAEDVFFEKDTSH